MGDRPHRLELGKHFTEGARLLWRALEHRRVARSDIARQTRVTTATVARWLYGDRRPARACAARLHELFAIPLGAWDVAPARAFAPPALEERLRRTAAERAGCALPLEAGAFAANDHVAPLSATG